MASFYPFNTYQPSSQSSHSNPVATNHCNRNRRVHRLTQNPLKNQIRVPRKEEEPIVVMSFRQRFEAGRSFDLDDDIEFCPGLITEYEMTAFNSAASDRSSLSGESPDSSPQSYQVSPSFNVNSNPTSYLPVPQNKISSSKYNFDHTFAPIHNSIFIDNPSLNNDLGGSPERYPHALGRRW